MELIWQLVARTKNGYVAKDYFDTFSCRWLAWDQPMSGGNLETFFQGILTFKLCDLLQSDPCCQREFSERVRRKTSP